MYKKQTLLKIVVAVSLIGSMFPAQYAMGRTPASFLEKKFSIEVNDLGLKELLRLIGEQGGVKFDAGTIGDVKVSYSFQETTLKEALDKISKDQGFNYRIAGNIIYVESVESESAEKATLGQERTLQGSSVRVLQVRHASAKEISEKVPKSFFKPAESLHIDETSNSLVFYGSGASFSRLNEFVRAFDRVPAQIVIESQIVETSKNFIRDVGFRWGSTENNPAVGHGTAGNGYINTGSPSNPNFVGKLLLGWVDGKTLEAHLMAAESTGDAKIISRPNVMTLNNQVATINSGVTFNVKTLSSTTTGGNGSTPGQNVVGGLQQVSAGLKLQVLPVIVGEKLIRLKINVTNSEPNDSLAVDGIPGIVDNSAATSVIVQDGQTAALAGLIKSSLSNSENRAPLLASIPILGWLFKSQSKKDRTSELVILITPRVLLPMNDQAPARVPAEASAR